MLRIMGTLSTSCGVAIFVFKYGQFSSSDCIWINQHVLSSGADGKNVQRSSRLNSIRRFDPTVEV